MQRRSNCPISNVLDIVGDKWSLLIVRDLLFFGKQTFSEIQTSDERVATNILSSRLEKLENDGLITKQADTRDKRKKVYLLSEKGIDMLPIMLEMILWSSKHDPDTNAPQDLVKRIQTDKIQLMSEVVSQLKREG
ncbi:winged helix-turn-helix transcriptional regulator [Thaumasiovibrio subtropicus]|uniref:winged helix-turn-helix transcriptional regulator n=1 Tax=Thaumasiovibrio subtropicus TaxID=1891207 RepID=UPI000B356661|nr:helix-turn-helix domain-containing protein [Thaumasiovibrio subtropicus]